MKGNWALFGSVAISEKKKTKTWKKRDKNVRAKKVKTANFRPMASFGGTEIGKEGQNDRKEGNGEMQLAAANTKMLA